MKPFICFVGGCTFMIKYFDHHEMHIFTCKDDPSLNWTEKVPRS